MPDQATGLLSAWLRKKRLEAIRPLLEGNVLDFGCGIGCLSEFVETEKYYGVDIDEESVLIAKNRYPQKQFNTSWPENKQFDTIVLMAVIEHLENPASLLKKLKSVLGASGCILITTPHPSMNHIYYLGSRMKIFAKHAQEEHKQYFELRKMKDLMGPLELEIVLYKRFLFRANQLFVIKHR